MKMLVGPSTPSSAHEASHDMQSCALTVGVIFSTIPRQLMVWRAYLIPEYSLKNKKINKLNFPCWERQLKTVVREVLIFACESILSGSVHFDWTLKNKCTFLGKISKDKCNWLVPLHATRLLVNLTQHTSKYNVMTTFDNK